jgi:hypothetical protein
MIIKFEVIEGLKNLRVLDRTWRGDSNDLTLHDDLTELVRRVYGETNDKVLTFEISVLPIEDSERFTLESIKKGLHGASYAHSTLGLHYICELLLLYVGPEYPKHFYIKKQTT